MHRSRLDPRRKDGVSAGHGVVVGLPRLDLGPHPYQRWMAERRATQPFRWSGYSESPTRMGEPRSCCAVHHGGRTTRRTFTVSLSSYHGVLAGRLPEPLGAELRLALQGVEVDVDQPEPVAKAVCPLEVSWALHRKWSGMRGRWQPSGWVSSRWGSRAAKWSQRVFEDRWRQGRRETSR
jgi:hypothetical protein